MTPYIIVQKVLMMSQFEKLLKRIHNLSNDLRFSEIKKILEYYGYTMSSPRRLSKNLYKHFGIIKNIIWENLYFIEMDKKSKNKELFAKNYAIIAIILLKPNLFKAILKL
jgi:hypothetical protein